MVTMADKGPIILVRRPDWALRFTEYLVESQRENIACDWQFNFCGKWVANGIEEMTGVDLMAPVIDREIKGPTDVYLALKKAGFESLEAYAESVCPVKPLIMANRGDVVTVKAEGEEYQGLGMSHALGFADPPFFWALRSDGLGRGPLLDCIRCFAVGGQ